MQHYSANRIGGDEKKVAVFSKRCNYMVTFEEEYVYIEGPGVNESDSQDDKEFYSLEDAAIHYVLLFESGLWPDE